MTTEEIIATTKRKGFLYVSWRYRDSGLRNQCKQLVKRGVLKQDWRGPGGDYFLLGHADMIERFLRNKAQRKELLVEATRRGKIEGLKEAKEIVDRLGTDEDCIHMLAEIDSRIASLEGCLSTINK